MRRIVWQLEKYSYVAGGAPSKYYHAASEQIAASSSNASPPSLIPSTSNLVLNAARMRNSCCTSRYPFISSKHPLRLAIARASGRTCTEPTTDSYAKNALPLQLFAHPRCWARPVAKFAFGSELLPEKYMPCKIQHQSEFLNLKHHDCRTRKTIHPVLGNYGSAEIMLPDVIYASLYSHPREPPKTPVVRRTYTP